MSDRTRPASHPLDSGSPLLPQPPAAPRASASAEAPSGPVPAPPSGAPETTPAPPVQEEPSLPANAGVEETSASPTNHDGQPKELAPSALLVSPPTQPSDANDAVSPVEPAVLGSRLSPSDPSASNPDESGLVAGEDSLLAQPAYDPSPSPRPGPPENGLVRTDPDQVPPPIEKEQLSVTKHQPVLASEQTRASNEQASSEKGKASAQAEQSPPEKERPPSTNEQAPVSKGPPVIPPETAAPAATLSQKARQGSISHLRRPIANPPPAHLEHVHSDTRAPEVPFDFNKFLEQMKLRSAVPVGEYVRSFIRNFARRPHTRASQVQLVMEFLAFITDLMTRTAPWSEQSPSEFDNAKEAMEKLVMSRLYNYTFSPAVAAAGKWPIQTDDLERDAVLDQKVALFAWVEEEHLDLPPVGASGGFLEFAVKELLKINHYKAPRDKLICILNVCKVIFGLIRQLKEDASADTFLPLLVLVVLRAKCPHLVSNVEYISHFRSPDRLNSEAGYYLTSLQGAITFIEQMDFASLSNITHEDFEQNVEDAAVHMAAEAERKRPQPKEQQPGLLEIAGSGVQTLKEVLAGPGPSRPSPAGSATATPPMSKLPSKPEDSREGMDPLGVTSGFGALTAPLASATLAEDTRQFFQRTGEAAKMGIGRPIGALNKLWSEATSPEAPVAPVPGPKPSAEASEKSRAVRAEDALPPMPSSSTATPPPQRNRLLALFSDGPTASEPVSPGGEAPFQGDTSGQANSLKLPLPAREQQDVPNPWAAGQQEKAKIETLKIMFPNMEGGVCRLMLEACHGNLEDTIDKLLAMG